MGQYKDLTGQRFGSLTVIKRAESINKRTRFLCRCDCGTEKIINAYSLRSGETKSCGCTKAERISRARTIHGDNRRTTKRARLYDIWSGMKNRCNTKSNQKYEYYGGRGITVCPEWNSSYAAFKTWAEANGYRDDLTLDRINNEAGYCPENCRWATYSEQAYNRRPKQSK